MMCSPIKDGGGSVIGVAQVINKNNEDNFSLHDCALFEKYLQVLSCICHRARLFTLCIPVLRDRPA